MIDPNHLCFRCMTIREDAHAPCPRCGARGEALHNASNQLPVGTILGGKYLLGCAMGQGGFGITYVGWDLNLYKKLAVKEYYPEGYASRDTLTRTTVTPVSEARTPIFQDGKTKFVREAQTLTRFTGDPGVVAVHDFFEENGTAYIVMDFVEGKTLRRIQAERGNRLPAGEVLAILRPLMESLSRVHAAGMLHRDIAPDNIILQPDGRAVLLDFGAARQMSLTGENSNTVTVKAGYAPEEQYRKHGEQGPWTDIYALCATIYKLTTGVTPVHAMERVASYTPLPPPNSLGAGFTPDQEAALMKGLAIYGGYRQKSVRELVTGLYGEAREQEEPEKPENGRTGFIPEEEPEQERTKPGGKRAAIRILGGVLLVIALTVILKLTGVLGPAPGKREAEAPAAGDAPKAMAATPVPTPTEAPTPTFTPTPSPTPEPVEKVLEGTVWEILYSGSDGWIALDRDGGESFSITEDTELVNINQATKSGDVVRLTVREDGDGGEKLIRAELVTAVNTKTVKGKVQEISTGFVYAILSNGEEREFFMPESCTMRNWSENPEGRRATIEYATVNGQYVIVVITLT